MKISECKFWNNCPFKENGKRSCVKEFELVYGKDFEKNPDATIIWSLQLCYDLKFLMDNGLVKRG